MSQYSFRAHYNDGSYQERGNYADIDRDRLVAFELFDINTDNTALKMVFLPGQKLIWRKRHELKSTGEEKIVHLIGKQENRGGKNYQSLALLFDDGHTEFFDKFDPRHPFLREVQLLPGEK